MLSTLRVSGDVLGALRDAGEQFQSVIYCLDTIGYQDAANWGWVAAWMGEGEMKDG